MYLASDSPTVYAMILAIGRTGVGKTQFLCTCPYPFIINADRKEAETAKKFSHAHGKAVPLYDVNAWEDMQKVVRWFEDAVNKGEAKLDGAVLALSPVEKGLYNITLEDAELPIETICLDGLTDLYEMLMYSIRERDGSLDRSADPGQYQRAHNQFEGMMHRLRRLPFHVVATGMEQMDKDEIAGDIRGGVELPGKMGIKSDRFIKMFNAVGRLKVQRTSKGPVYTMNIQGDHRWPGKCEFFDHPKADIVPTFAALMGEE